MGASGRGESFSLQLRAGDVFDRFQLQEDIVLGQRVRNYTIESSSTGLDAGTWQTLVSGSAIGAKRIQLLPEAVTVTADSQIRLRITAAAATPELKFFGAFRPCANGTEITRDILVV